MGVGLMDMIPFGPSISVSATVVENGPVGAGAVACNNDELRVGVIGCRLNEGGLLGGVKPEPLGGSSPVGDISGVKPTLVPSSPIVTVGTA